MKSRKGQIALFMIVGVIVVLGAFLFFNYKSDNFFKSSSIEEDSKNSFISGSVESQVNDYIQNCVDKISEEAIFGVGKQGGLFQEKFPLGEVFLAKSNTYVPYYVQDNKIDVPTVSNYESSLENYMDFALPSCLSGFDSFKKKGYEIDYSKPFTTVSIDNIVIFKVMISVKLKFSQDDSIFLDGPFVHSVGIDLIKINNILNNITISLSKDSSMIPIGKINKMALENSFTFGIINVNPSIFLDIDEEVSYDNTKIMYVHFNQAIGNGPYLLFNFAFDRKQQTKKNLLPKLEIEPYEQEMYIKFIEDVNMSLDEIKEVQVEVVNGEKTLSYALETSLSQVKISEGGIISINPEEKGLFDVVVRVNDVEGNGAEQMCMVKVND